MSVHTVVESEGDGRGYQEAGTGRRAPTDDHRRDRVSHHRDIAERAPRSRPGRRAPSLKGGRAIDGST